MQRVSGQVDHFMFCIFAFDRFCSNILLEGAIAESGGFYVFFPCKNHDRIEKRAFELV